MAEALKPIVEFRKYKLADNGTVRDFYSLLRPTIKSARTVGHLKLIINNQTAPCIVGKMPHTERKLWATNRPEWIHEDVVEAFEKFLE
jgi:hypothetical protein